MGLRSTGLLPLTVVIVAGCGGEEPNQGGTGQSQSPLTEIISNDGRRFVLSSAAESALLRSAGSSGVSSMSASFRGKSIDEMDVDELAEALRPVTFVGGREYRLESPDYEAASLAMSGTLPSGRSYNPDGRATRLAASESFMALSCCGTDDRSVVRNNTAWPYKTVIAMAVPDSGTYSWTGGVHGECTMQLIGASTATSVAHCFHDGNNWLELAMWGAGPDAQDNPIFPANYPGAYGCYLVYVPTAWIESGGTFQYDYAVIDFRGTCQPSPGNDVGWLGWGAYSDAEIESTGAYAYGVPAMEPYPQIRGMWTNYTTIRAGSNYIDHAADCSEGDSGRALRQYIRNDWRVTGSHSRAPVNSKCRDRRLTDDVVSFITANSEF